MTRSPTRLATKPAALALGALVLAGLGWWLLAGSPQGASCGGASVAGAKIGGPFALVDEDGRAVTDADVLTQPSLVYFGYSYCPDICPTDSARNAEVVDLLAARGIDLRLVLISVDPARDTPEVLKSFTDLFHPQMLGLTGTDQQVAAAAREYRAFYTRSGNDPENYAVDHSTFTYLMLPGRGFADYFKREDTPQAMADAIACHLGQP